MEGDYMAYYQVHVELSKLTEGDYVIFIKAEWEGNLHPCKRLVMNIYAPDPLEMKRIHTYSEEVINEMESYLNERLMFADNFRSPEV